MNMMWRKKSGMDKTGKPGAQADASGRAARGFAKPLLLLLLFAGSLLGTTSANAVACNSLATGSWATAGTWSCGHVPLATDDVTIVAGHVITMSGNPGRALSLVINGTANWTQGRTTNVGTGGITINAGGDITGAANGLLTSTGGLNINAVLTSTTVTVRLQTTAAQTISGTGSLARLTVNGVTATNTGTLTVTTALAGTGGLANAGTLNIASTTVAITTLTATAAGNTVNYTGAVQTVKATAYHHLALSNAGTKSLAGATTVAGNFSVGAGATFSNGANALSVAGNFDQSGTFTAGAGVVTLNGGGAVQTISGTGPLGFANLTVSNTGGITLARNVTVTSAIIGAVTLTPTCPVDYMLTSNGGATVAHSCPAPAVVSINLADANPTTAASVSWTVTFSRSVTGVSSGNFALVNTGLGGAPAITSVAGSGTVWTVTASTGTGDGTLGLDMVNDTGVSLAMTNLPFTGQVYSINRSVPAVLSIARADPTPTALASVSWNVTFSESVTGVDAADFALVWAGGAGGGGITSVTGSGAAWVVTASTGATNGTLGLNLVDDDSIVDTANNPLGGAGAGNGNFTGEVYTLNFTVPSFVFTNSPCVHNIAFGAPTQTCALVTWSPQVAGQNLAGVYITAVSAAGVPTRLSGTQVRTRNMQFGLTCHDPLANAGVQAVFAGQALPLCQASGGTPAAWSATVTVTFNAGSPSSAVSYTFNYADVGMVELWMRNSATPTQVGYSGPFVAKPGGFVLSGIQQTAAPNLVNPAAADAAGTKFVKAGEAFSVTVTATTCSPASATCTVAGAATPNYGKEVMPEGVRFVDISLPSTDPNYADHGTLVAGLGLTNNPAIGGAFGVFANGVATGTAFTWNEAGIITLTPSVGDGDYLGAGDVTGTTSGNVGRFHAAQFALSGGIIANRTTLSGCAAPAGCDTFTYMGEQMSAVFNLTAKAADGTTTLQNYNYSATAANNFAKFDPTATGNPLVLGAVDTGAPRTVATLDVSTYGVASGSFASGVASVTAPFAVTRGASTSGPFDALAVGVAPVDGDGAALATLDLAVNAAGAPNTHGMVGSTKARYGRMKLDSAHGSELLKLPIPMEVQYWQGQYWVQNGLDDATTIVQNNVKLATISGPAVTISSITKDAAGKWRVILNKPLVAASSNVCLDLDTGATGDTSCQAAMPLSMPYLQAGAAFDKDPASRATFGVYKGSNEFIYLREVY